MFGDFVDWKYARFLHAPKLFNEYDDWDSAFLYGSLTCLVNFMTDIMHIPAVPAVCLVNFVIDHLHLFCVSPTCLIKSMIGNMDLSRVSLTFC